MGRAKTKVYNETKFSKRITELQIEAGYNDLYVVMHLTNKEGLQLITDVQTLNSYKIGKRMPRDILQILCAFADFYHVSVDYLVGRDDVPNRDIASVTSTTGLSSKSVKTLARMRATDYIHAMIDGVLEETTLDDNIFYWNLYMELYSDFRDEKEIHNISYDMVTMQKKIASRDSFYNFIKAKSRNKLNPLLEKWYKNEVNERSVPLDMNFNTGQECVINSNKIEVTQITELEPEA